MHRMGSTLFDGNADVKFEHYKLLPWNDILFMSNASAQANITCEQGLSVH